MAVKVDNRCLSRFTLVIVLATLVTISCSSLPFLVAPTPVPTQIFMPTPTGTPTATLTPTPTGTPASTLNPTATLVRFDASLQTDSTTLVTDWLYEYQFNLPQGWEVNEPTGRSWFDAEYSYAGGRNLRLAVYVSEREGTLEFELSRLTTRQVGDLDRVLASGIGTNGHGTTLAYLESAIRITGLIRPAYYDEYDIAFVVEEQIIDIHFYVIDFGRTEFGDTDTRAIHAIQNSIQIR